MKLKFQYINEETGEKLILKNEGSKVFYHSSEIHDPKEFEELTGKVLKFKLGEPEKLLIDSFYELAGKLI